MSPERRARVIAALDEIRAMLTIDDENRDRLDQKTDAELTALLVNIEALLERAQGTDI